MVGSNGKPPGWVAKTPRKKQSSASEKHRPHNNARRRRGRLSGLGVTLVSDGHPKRQLSSTYSRKAPLHKRPNVRHFRDGPVAQAFRKVAIHIRTFRGDLATTRATQKRPTAPEHRRTLQEARAPKSLSCTKTVVHTLLARLLGRCRWLRRGYSLQHVELCGQLEVPCLLRGFLLVRVNIDPFRKPRSRLKPAASRGKMRAAQASPTPSFGPTQTPWKM